MHDYILALFMSVDCARCASARHRPRPMFAVIRETFRFLLWHLPLPRSSTASQPGGTIDTWLSSQRRVTKFDPGCLIDSSLAEQVTLSWLKKRFVGTIAYHRLSFIFNLVLDARTAPSWGPVKEFLTEGVFHQAHIWRPARAVLSWRTGPHHDETRHGSWKALRAPILLLFWPEDMHTRVYT